MLKNVREFQPTQITTCKLSNFFFFLFSFSKEENFQRNTEAARYTTLRGFPDGYYHAAVSLILSPPKPVIRVSVRRHVATFLFRSRLANSYVFVGWKPGFPCLAPQLTNRLIPEACRNVASWLASCAAAKWRLKGWHWSSRAFAPAS